MSNSPSAEASDLFELARAYDSDIYRVNQSPESGPPVLEKYKHVESDREKSRQLYEQAAKLGYTAAMYRLAVFQAEGLGLAEGADDRPDFVSAFYWFKEAARRGDPYAFNALANFYLYGIERDPDPVMGEKCLITAAKYGLVEAQIRLAQFDLGILDGYDQGPKKPPVNIERGLRLLENVALNDGGRAFDILGQFYFFDGIGEGGAKLSVDPRSEYYQREAIKRGLSLARTGLSGHYRLGYFGEESKPLDDCLESLNDPIFYPDSVDFANVETLCPRPGGPLTRTRVGLPPAPTEPLNVRAYLEEFEIKYGGAL